MNAPYKWIGRKIRHAHATVGERKLNPEPLTFSTRWLNTHPGVFDQNSCNCGYAICSKTGPCAPKPSFGCDECWTRLDTWPAKYRGRAHLPTCSKAPKPVDALPDGWRLDTFVTRHTSGAWVQPFGSMWAWASSEGGSCAPHNLVYTRDEAMACALAAAKPVDALPDGWRDITHPDGVNEMYRHDKGALVSRLKPGIGQPDDQWCWSLSEDVWGYKPTRELAMAAALTCGKTDDTLPEGWSQHYADKYTFVHVEGHEVRESIDGSWLWWRAPIVGSPSSGEPKATRTDAMDAALEASKPKACAICLGTREPLRETGECFRCWPEKPAEPELRPGWRGYTDPDVDSVGWNGQPAYWRGERDAYGNERVVFRVLGDRWRVRFDESGRDEPTREAALIRAEQLWGDK